MKRGAAKCLPLKGKAFGMFPAPYTQSSVRRTGFSAAFFNTLLFMSSLVLLFGNTEYIQNMMAGRGVIAFIVASVGINAVVEMAVAALVTSAVGVALRKARLIKS